MCHAGICTVYMSTMKMSLHFCGGRQLQLFISQGQLLLLHPFPFLLISVYMSEQEKIVEEIHLCIKNNS